MNDKYAVKWNGGIQSIRMLVTQHIEISVIPEAEKFEFPYWGRYVIPPLNIDWPYTDLENWSKKSVDNWEKLTVDGEPALVPNLATLKITTKLDEQPPYVQSLDLEKKIINDRPALEAYLSNMVPGMLSFGYEQAIKGPPNE